MYSTYGDAQGKWLDIGWLDCESQTQEYGGACEACGGPVAVENAENYTISECIHCGAPV